MTPAQLRAARERLGLTQRQLAEALPAHPNTVARWERGEIPPPPLLYRAMRDLEREYRHLR